MKSVNVKTTNEISNQNNDANNRIELVLSKSVIWILLILISINNALISMSPIILHSCQKQIKFELKLSAQMYDLLKTFHNLGALLGSILFTLVIEKINHKTILISFLLINCLCHFSFYLKLSFLAISISRFVSGLVSTFCFIYFPFWVDKFGINNWIGFMHALVQIFRIIGIYFAYFLIYLIGHRKWNFGFLLESVLVTIVTFLMYLAENAYYDQRYIDMERENKIDINIEKIEKETIVKDIFLNFPFLLLQVSRGKIIFINQIIRYCYNSKVDFNVFINEKNLILHSYLFNTLFVSVIGIITGSLLIYMIGGQYSRYNFLLIFYLQLASCFLGFISNKFNSTSFFNIMICLFNFFISASSIISLIVSFAIMPKTLKGISCGILTIIHNLIGVLPAKKGYNLIKDYFGKQRIINALMLYGMVGCIELIVADFYMKFNKIKLYQKY
jgi:hypothetical protein